MIYEKDVVLGLAVACTKEDVAYIPVAGFVTEQYLFEQSRQLLAAGTEICTFDLKPQLKWIEADEKSHIFDVKIAAYLLNPLKNDYAYEDIAKDYLDLMVPSKEDYLGKKDLATASEEKPEEFLKMACYQAYINLMAKEPLAKQLEEEGMKELFDKIEMPLVYTLSDMEKEGIAIDADALKEYGENLAVSIDKIEKKSMKKPVRPLISIHQNSLV